MLVGLCRFFVVLFYVKMKKIRHSCRKQQSLVENKKGLSETTKHCRKQERFAGKDKGLPEKTKLCLKQQSLFGPELANS
jgi:hypothetical protein